MTIVEKSVPLETLGLREGDEVVSFTVEHGKVVYRVATASAAPLTPSKKPGSAGEWARQARGSARRLPGETHDDARMAYYREKFGVE